MSLVAVYRKQAYVKASEDSHGSTSHLLLGTLRLRMSCSSGFHVGSRCSNRVSCLQGKSSAH